MWKQGLIVLTLLTVGLYFVDSGETLAYMGRSAAYTLSQGANSILDMAGISAWMS